MNNLHSIGEAISGASSDKVPNGMVLPATSLLSHAQIEEILNHLGNGAELKKATRALVKRAVRSNQVGSTDLISREAGGRLYLNPRDAETLGVKLQKSRVGW